MDQHELQRIATALEAIAIELLLANDLTIDVLPPGITQSDWGKRAVWRRGS